MQPLNGASRAVEEDSEDEYEEFDEEELAEQRAQKKKYQQFIFYDFESMVVDKKHVPNLCVLHKVCELCIEEPDLQTSQCQCKPTQVVFNGSTTLEQVGTYLFSGEHKGAICIAHNSQGYDAHLLLEYIHENGLKPEIIENGTKIMSMEVQFLTFIDSLNYFHTPLAKLPKMFGLHELQKGFFPHLFNTIENQTHVGPMPPTQFYDPEGMMEGTRQEFYKWYANQTHFNLQVDLVKYCVSDVDILRRCCGRFRTLFKETTGIDPFYKSFTIASACNRVYRMRYLKPNQIAIIPPHGYNADNQSAIALVWLDWIAKSQGVTMRHAHQGGEVKIAGMKVEAYVTEPYPNLAFY